MKTFGVTWEGFLEATGAGPGDKNQVRVVSGSEADSTGPGSEGGSGLVNPLFLSQKPVGNHCIFALHRF